MLRKTSDAYLYQYRMRTWISGCPTRGVAGVRRASLREAERGADAGPSGAARRRLDQIRLNSATQSWRQELARSRGLASILPDVVSIQLGQMT